MYRNIYFYINQLIGWGGKNIRPVRIQTAPGYCGPGMKPDRSWVSLDKLKIQILLKKYYKIFIILNILYLFNLFITHI